MKQKQWREIHFEMARGIKILCSIWIFVLGVCAMETACFAKEETEKQQGFSGSLYAGSAVLMDGSSGRVLYEKNGEDFMANASTTKILTCILALENGQLTDVVNVSAYAASMPDVQLHIKEGEQYYLGDLLYSLMLESHNDVAVAIAEHIAGSQEEFSRLMNQKAGEIGCTNSRFLTPNGLDATVKVKENEKERDASVSENSTKEGVQNAEMFHGTTATDLALIMRYCIKISPQREEFLRVTGTPSYSFQNIDKTRSFTCRNHNTFLNMMEGAISGKTGFTGKAGYCYVGALEQEGKCYIVALLACGWPGNKNYKWSDSRKLMEYGLENYELVSLEEAEHLHRKEFTAEVEQAKRESIRQETQIPLMKKEGDITEVLLRKDESLRIQISKNKLTAPVKKEQVAGVISYYIDDRKWKEEVLICKNEAEKIDYGWCFQQIMGKIFK